MFRKMAVPYNKNVRELKLSTFLRSSRPDVFCEKGVLRNFAKFTRKHLCQSLFFKKVAGDTFFYRTPLVAASGCRLL